MDSSDAVAVAVAVVVVSAGLIYLLRRRGTVKSKYYLPPKRKTFGDTIKTLYHITAHGEEIRSSGEMRRGSAGAVGGGIYFAESEAECAKKALSTGWLVKARVLVGRTKQVDVSGFFGPLRSLMNQWSFRSLHDRGYDSVEVIGFHSGKEYIVYSKDQVELVNVTRRS